MEAALLLYSFWMVKKRQQEVLYFVPHDDFKKGGGDSFEKCVYWQAASEGIVTDEYGEDQANLVKKHTWDWEGAWGAGQTFQL